MHTKTLVTTLSLLLVAASPGTCPAGETDDLQLNRIELGVGWLTDDAYRFGRYTGLTDEGAYPVGDIKARDYREDGDYWRARGTNLGLDSRYLRLEGGTLGQQQYFLEYDQLPNNWADSANTPFLGVGHKDLTLPPDFAINTDLDSSLHPFDIETERKRIGLGASLFRKQRWRLNISGNHETRDGTGRIGGAIAGIPGGGGGNGGGGGGGGGGGVLGNTTAALLPEPVDDTTDLLDVSLQYIKDKAQLNLAYHVSLYDNDEHSLTWVNPFDPGTPDDPNLGRLALAPDNEFHQVMLSGSYLLPYRSQLTGLVSTGRMTQDQGFEPYTVNTAITTDPLPRNSLDAEVWVRTAQLKLASRPLPKLRLTAEYRYDERDNDTDVDDYDMVVADAYNPAGTVENRPLSYDRNQVDLTANYRINTAMSLRGGYRYDDMSRDYTDAEREDTKENTFFTKWKVKPHAAVDLALYGETGHRDGSSYHPLENENPALRKYYLADRDRSKVGASVDYQATDTLSLTASADYIKDDYDNTDIGLTESTRPTWTLDASWQPREDLTTHAFYTHEDIKSKQSGQEVWSGTAMPDWKADFDDTVDTWGLSAKMTGIRGRWDVGADLVYSSATGEADLKNLSPAGMVTQYPDLETDLTSLKLWTQYHYRKDISLKLSYWYEEYSADNWALDNLQEDSIGNLLLLGEDTQNYNAHAIGASVIYRF
jgi:MtrB/PioB family decaheme-associated outer membrane protein